MKLLYLSATTLSSPRPTQFVLDPPGYISGGEDGTVKLWNSGTYRLENTLSYALERAWCIELSKTANANRERKGSFVVFTLVKYIRRSRNFTFGSCSPAF